MCDSEQKPTTEKTTGRVKTLGETLKRRSIPPDHPLYKRGTLFGVRGLKPWRKEDQKD